jgi:hypothetical protein
MGLDAVEIGNITPSGDYKTANVIMGTGTPSYLPTGSVGNVAD